MTIVTPRLIIAAHLPRHLRALARSDEEFENTAGLRVSEGIRDQLLSGSPDFLTKLQTAKQADPWQFGFAIIHRIDNALMGMCGFPGPPNDQGVAEIAYGIAPEYQGQGYATEAATALIEFATNDPRVKRVCAHTLPEVNASTRVLEKCGFQRAGESIDPENNLTVWRWERGVSSRTK
jgi:ribosomal-protein-alanine N-acetyltransferase